MSARAVKGDPVRLYALVMRLGGAAPEAVQVDAGTCPSKLRIQSPAPTPSLSPRILHALSSAAADRFSPWSHSPRQLTHSPYGLIGNGAFLNTSASVLYRPVCAGCICVGRLLVDGRAAAGVVADGTVATTAVGATGGVTGCGTAESGGGAGVCRDTSCTCEGAAALRASGDCSTAETTSRRPLLVGASVSADPELDDAAWRSWARSADGPAGLLQATIPPATASDRTATPDSQVVCFITTTSAGELIHQKATL